MSNKSKFKIGDTVVRIKGIDTFPYGNLPVTVSKVSPAGFLWFKENNDIEYWYDNYFELYVKPENKVPDNMEIVGYQVKVGNEWWYIDEPSYEMYTKDKDGTFTTRIIYAFKQD